MCRSAVLLRVEGVDEIWSARVREASCGWCIIVGRWWAIRGGVVALVQRSLSWDGISPQPRNSLRRCHVEHENSCCAPQPERKCAEVIISWTENMSRFSSLGFPITRTNGQDDKYERPSTSPWKVPHPELQASFSNVHRHTRLVVVEYSTGFARFSIYIYIQGSPPGSA